MRADAQRHSVDDHYTVTFAEAASDMLFHHPGLTAAVTFGSFLHNAYNDILSIQYEIA